MKVFNFSKATMLLILASIWISANTYSQSIESGKYYRLTTQFQGDGKSLDVVNDGKNNNQLELLKTGNFTGQYWKFTSLGNGFYRMTTFWQGDDKSLDVVNEGANSNKLIMAKTGNLSGQYWKITSLGSGFNRLTTQFQGDGKSLDVVNAGANSKTLTLAKTGNLSGQYWKLTPLEKDQNFGGNGGTEFAYTQIKTIGLRHGVNVDAIIINGKSYGGNGGTATKTLTLAADEFISKIEVNSGPFVNYLKITTNKGNVIEGGKINGKSAIIQGTITALGGRGGNLLDQLKVRSIPLL